MVYTDIEIEPIHQSSLGGSLPTYQVPLKMKLFDIGPIETCGLNFSLSISDKNYFIPQGTKATKQPELFKTCKH